MSLFSTLCRARVNHSPLCISVVFIIDIFSVYAIVNPSSSGLDLIL